MNTMDWRHYYRDNEGRERGLPEFLRGAGLILTIATGGAILYRSGLIRPIVQKALMLSGRYNLGAADDVVRGLRNLAQQEESFLKTLGKLPEAGEYIKDAARTAVPFELDKALTSSLEVLEKLRPTLVSEAVAKQLPQSNIDAVMRGLIDEIKTAITGRFGVTPEAQSAMFKAAGVRYVTAEDVTNLLTQGALAEPRYRAMGLRLGALGLERSPLRVDPGLFITETGQIINRSKLSSAVRNILTSLEDDFAIPFVGFNPLRLFRMGNILGLRQSPLVHLFDEGAIQPIVTGKTEPIDRAIFIGGKVFDLNKALTTGKLELLNPGRTGYLLPMSDPVVREHARAMAGIPTRVYEPFDKGARGVYAKLMRQFGFGFQDALPWGDPEFGRVPGSGMLPGINDIYANLSRMVTRATRPWSSYEIPDITRRFLSQKWFYVNRIDVQNISSILPQLTAGRRNLADVTTLSLTLYTGMSRMNSMMANFGLALPVEYMGSTAAVFSNMFLRRAAFIGLGLFAWRYLNYEMENLFGFRPELAAAEAWAGATVGLAAIGERLGLPEKVERLGHLLPGIDQITELPGVRGLTFWAGMTPEEVREYWESGEDPVRKGRYWPLGSTQFTGGRISYFRPNRLRLLRSKWQYTDTLYGSEDEYFAHAPIPTPRYPLAPIRRYITDRYWQERRTYYERPYPVTGGLPELEGVPLFGPLLSHVSDIIKPRLKMHPKFWAQVVPEGETAPARTKKEAFLKPPYWAPIGLRGQLQEEAMPAGDEGVELEPAAGLPYAIYGGPPGAGGATPPAGGFTDEYGRPITSRRSPARTLEQLWSNLTEMAGFYGFAVESMRAEERTAWHRRDLATASNMTSWNRLFWDSEIGGLGGDVNEILRRAMSRRHRVERDYNPIPNRMPSWLPQEYILDLYHGDPYTKVRAGEIRLPGAAYESIYYVPAAEYIKSHPVLSELDRLGIINRYEFYDPINRLRILASVAPWSDEFRETSKLLSSVKLSAEQEREVKKIRAQARQMRHPLRLYPYRFRYSELETETVTVKRILNKNTILTEEYPDHPVRLAGIKPVAEAKEWLEERLSPGTRITIGYDPHSKIARDTYRTIRAVVYSGYTNINRALLLEGLAEEKEDDFSAPAVHARFNRGERTVGKLWDAFAHLGTPFHTKMLQVRSAYEDWVRREVYGKNVQLWQRPWSDYVVPTYQSLISHHPITSIAIGTFLGSLFGRTNYGRIIGGAVGAGLMGAGVLYRMLYELMQGEKWVPARRRREWELEEYMDILKYIKYRRLFETETKRAQAEEDFDVVAYINEERAFRSAKKERLEELSAVKRQLYTGRVGNVEAELRALGLELPADAEEEDVNKLAMRVINAEIGAVQQSKFTERELPPHAAKAMEYYRQMRTTMYAYKPGEPLGEFIAALPRKERRYFRYFLKMPEQEYEKLKDVAPHWLFYGLAPTRGDAPPPKPNLYEYFQHRFLPEEEWPGWRPDVSLEDVRVKLAKHVVRDVKDIDIWPDDEARAAMVPVPAPQIYRPRERGRVLQEHLERLLSGIGVEDIEAYVEPYDGGVAVDLDLEWDVRDELIDLINRDPAILLS